MFIKSQSKCESQFSMHNDCIIGTTCRMQFGLISFWTHTSMHIMIGSADKQKKLWVFHFVMFHMHSTYYVDSLSKSTVFFCFPSSIHVGEFYCTAHHHLWLHCWHLLWKEFHSLVFILLIPMFCPYATLGVPKLQYMGQIWPAKTFAQ